MKKTLFLTVIYCSLFTTVSSAETTILDHFSFSADTCDAIDKKIVSLDQFTQVVKNTSAFHLEEKASALPSPGFTVSNNKKKMLKDAKEKRAEYLAERQKYGCETPLPQSTAQTVKQMPVTSKTTISSDTCDAIDRKIVSLDQFTQVVQNTSAFHLEEKASALPSPGFTVSNNKKKMLKDAMKKRAEYLADRQKYGCETPLPQSRVQTAEKMPVKMKHAISSDRDTSIEEKTTKSHQSTANVDTVNISHVDKKAVVLSVPKTNESHTATKIVKDKEVSQEDQSYESEVRKPQRMHQMTNNTSTSVNTPVSVEACNSIDQELIKLDEFTIMVNNTSAFHLEEKVQAMPVPGITVSSNKKKILRDVKRKRAEYLAERQKQGCETAEKK